LGIDIRSSSFRLLFQHLVADKTGQLTRRMRLFRVPVLSFYIHRHGCWFYCIIVFGVKTRTQDYLREKQ